jgi:nitroimidazol reductase NimA-like FMN-containing flavoprotein (pyridoxamine 5'-phosphate oxidase superfamily)
MSAALVDVVLRRTAYMTLATANGDGLPWASPVWFAVGDNRALYWVSRPTSVHSQNIAARADVSVVVFDTNARVGEAQAVYARAQATQVPDGEGIEVFSRASVDAGIGPWAVANVTAPAEVRLYRADVTELSLLDPQATGGRDVRVQVGMTMP